MLLDMHCHTGWGSGDSHTDPNTLIKQAKSYGLDGLCLTEHNQLWDESKLRRLSERHEFALIPGIEIDTDLGHVLAFGLEKPRRWSQFPTITELRQCVDDAGGVMILAHPFRKREKPVDENLVDGHARALVDEELENDVLHAFDAIEVFNGLAGKRERLLAGSLAQRLKKPTTGGSDTHRHPEVGATFTVFEGEIHTVEELICAVKDGRMHGGDWETEAIPDRRHERIIGRS